MLTVVIFAKASFIEVQWKREIFDIYIFLYQNLYFDFNTLKLNIISQKVYRLKKYRVFKNKSTDLIKYWLKRILDIIKFAKYV